MEPTYEGLLRVPLAILNRLSAQPESPTGRGAIKEGPAVDPAFKRLLMYLIVGTKGGFNRLQIMKLIQEQPLNPNKIGENLKLDYKTVQHHLRILTENGIVVTSSPSGTYGAMYFLSPYAERHIGLVDDIWARFGKRQK